MKLCAVMFRSFSSLRELPALADEPKNPMLARAAELTPAEALMQGARKALPGNAARLLRMRGKREEEERAKSELR